MTEPDLTTGPRAFTDTGGRIWPVSVTVADLKRVRQVLGVELGKMTLQQLAELVADPASFADVLYVLVRREHPDVTDEQFGEALCGDPLEAASLAFWRAWADFCPSQTRPLVLALARKAAEMRAEAVEQATTILNGSLASWPAPRAGSTPAPGPSAS